ncbi:MAG: hypothetical protein QXN00_01580 [Candidatus Aenigmatarchaeota archaeon]
MVEKYFKQAFDAFSKNWLSLILGLFVIFIIIGVFMGIGLVAGIASIGIANLTSPQALMTSIFSGLSIVSIMMLIGTLVGLILFVGYIRLCADSIKGKASLSSMFSVAKENAITTIITSIILSIILTILFAPLTILLSASLIATPTNLMNIGITALIGSIITYLIIILFALSFHGIAIDNLGPIETIKKSISIVMKNYILVLLISIIYLILYTVINFIPLIGSLISLFVIIPMCLISLTAIYLEKRR